MIEEKIRFRSQGLSIEGLVCTQNGEKGAVITHPHPLYGGTMYNQVVEVLAKVYQGKGFSTLRFNFRGVGQSEGSYDQGNGESEDVRSALLFFHDMGKGDCDLAGYSFGAWVNAKTKGIETLCKRLIMVSPPAGLLDFSSLFPNVKIEAILTGSEDDIAPVDRIKSLTSIWNSGIHCEVIQGADHFYSGRTEILESALSRLIT